MKIDLYAEGDAFSPQGLSLNETLGALGSVASTLKNCIEIAADNKLSKSAPKPALKIHYVRPGSLDAQFLIDVSGAIATLSPLVPDYVYKMVCSSSWDLFVKTYKVAIAMAKYFSENKTPITNNVTVFPGGIANFIQQGGNINMSSALDESVKKCYKEISALASLLNSTLVTHVTASTDFLDDTDPSYSPKIDFSGSEGHYFSVPEIETHDPDPIEIPCRIFSINRKSNNGRLDYFDEAVGPKPIPFSIKEGDINDYIDAMKKDSAIVTATRTFMVNALGERKIAQLHLRGVAFS